MSRRNFEILSRGPSTSSGNSFRLMARRTTVESVRDFLVSSEPACLISFFSDSLIPEMEPVKNLFRDKNSMNLDD